MTKVIEFAKRNIVMLVALTLAVGTAFVVPPDGKYAGYFDLKTLTCLFCVLAVVCALKNVNFFYALAKRIVQRFKTTRSAIIALVYITFIGSMFIANDMALLTFLPLGYLVLDKTGKQKYMAFTFIMQNIAANLGGMLTPFGNPQNLYLYTKFAIPNTEFVRIMFFPFAISVGIITVCCLCVRREPLVCDDAPIEVDPKRTAVYMMLFALAIVIVFRIIPYWIGLVVIVPSVFVMDKRALKMVDYPLLMTFVFFFVFSGNMARIGAVRGLFSFLLGKSTLVFSALSCQVISNVPSAILLSQFTANYPDLLVGVNIGGVGTLIASLASLITYREYISHNPQKSASYIGLFSLFNFGFLAVLVVSQIVVKSLI